MKAISFEEQNGELSNNNPKYYNVPTHVCNNATGDVIMKIQVTQEEWDQVKENGFCFWYIRQTGNGGLQPFSFQIEKPFRMIPFIKDLSGDNLRKILFNGALIGNSKISSQQPLIEVISAYTDVIAYKVIVPRSNDVWGTFSDTYDKLSRRLIENGHSETYLILNQPEDEK